MQVRTEGSETYTLTELHVCEPPPRACCTARSGEARKGVKVDVVDDAKEAIEQQARGGHDKTLLKGGSEKMEIHVGTGYAAPHTRLVLI
jgi:hypothetical protein